MTRQVCIGDNVTRYTRYMEPVIWGLHDRAPCDGSQDPADMPAVGPSHARPAAAAEAQASAVSQGRAAGRAQHAL